jgi:hypothetical protein
MTPQERAIVAELLNMAADHFANHGCNDFDLHGKMSVEEAERMWAEYQQWNSGGRDAPPKGEDALYCCDWMLMGWFAHKIMQQRCS